VKEWTRSDRSCPKNSSYLGELNKKVMTKMTKSCSRRRGEEEVSASTVVRRDILHETVGVHGGTQKEMWLQRKKFP
jgi:hypothetical protein